VAIVAVAVLSACGSDGPDARTAQPEAATTDAAGDASESATADPTATAATAEVKALDNTFIEDEVDVAVGTEVVWKNGGRNDHDIVPVVEGEGWGVGMEEFHPGDTYSYVFTEPGEYAYYCTIHGTADVGTTGTIIVT
jgi:plastocyanin